VRDERVLAPFDDFEVGKARARRFQLTLRRDAGGRVRSRKGGVSDVLQAGTEGVIDNTAYEPG
jgi:hypothetical protein